MRKEMIALARISQTSQNQINLKTPFLKNYSAIETSKGNDSWFEQLIRLAREIKGKIAVFG